MSNGTVATTRLYTEDQLREIKSFEDAFQLAIATGGIVSVGDVIGDGFELTKDKQQFVGQEMVVLTWAFSESDDYTKQTETGETINGRFATIRVITRRGKFVINDGSTGLAAQLESLSERGINGNVHCPKGLRVSEYDYTDPKSGEVSKAKTYYLDSAA